MDQNIKKKNRNNAWEKSFIFSRVCGSYADMDAGNISEALMDFTGGPHVTIKLSEASDKLWDTMRRASQSEYLMGCGTPGGVKTAPLILAESNSKYKQITNKPMHYYYYHKNYMLQS